MGRMREGVMRKRRREGVKYRKIGRMIEKEMKKGRGDRRKERKNEREREGNKRKKGRKKGRVREINKYRREGGKE